MPYSNAIPQANHQLNNSQLDLLNNFIAIQNLIGVNHVNFNLGAQSGKHTQVTLPQNVAPTPTIAGELNIWSDISVNTNALELKWQRAAAGQITEWTAARVEAAHPNFGWSRFPSGLLIKWGVGTINAVNTATVIAYPLNINGIVAPIFGPGPGVVFTVFTTPINNGLTSVNIDPAGIPLPDNNFTVRGFTLGAVPFDFFYVAIGR